MPAILEIFRVTLVEVGPEWRNAENLLDLHRPQNVDLVLRRGEHVGLVFLGPAIDKRRLAVRAQQHKGRSAFDTDRIAAQRGEIGYALLVVGVGTLHFFPGAFTEIQIDRHYPDPAG
jgi:hypothetical protein